MGTFRDPDEAFTRIASATREAKKEPSATHHAEQRKKDGLGINPLVDPKELGVIRISVGPREKEKEGKYFKLLRGPAILEETRLDTTSSMGNNVDVALAALPKAYNMYALGKNAVLGRYDVQIITSIFGDIGDDYVLLRSQAEMAEKIVEQMTLMVPERAGGDIPEDPHYGIFASAYLTNSEINKYGLKRYDFTVTDAPAHEKFYKDILIRIFGDKVFEKVKENGHPIDPENLPTPKEVVADLLKNAHAFLLYVDLYPGHGIREFWEKIYGKDRVITLPRTQLLSEVKAAIIGLTEGVVTLQNLEEYLKGIADLNDRDVQAIKKAVSVIPIGAQAALENFDKIPKKGDLFKAKDSLWPVSPDEVGDVDDKKETSTSKKKKKWL
jgi:hypothetical protein